MNDPAIGCLVVGSPRSGTTLCASMIGGHPDIGMLFEDVGHGGREVLGTKVWGNKLCIPNQITLDPRPDERSVWKRLEDGVRAILGRPRMLPWLSESYPAPHRQYTIRTYVEQGARVVAMLRDPDHVVDSIRRRGAVSVERGKYRWSRAVRAINQTKQDYPDRTYIIRFPNLLDQPGEVMRDVCTLLGLSYSPAMKEGYMHTPQYSHDRLDPAVANRDVESYDLETFDPEAVEMYSRLAGKAEKTL